MPLLQTIADLFRNGAVSIAEQFIRGTTAVKSFAEIMANRFGNDFQVNTQSQLDFLATISEAAEPARIIQAGGIVDTSQLPSWLDSPTPGEIIHTGLAEIRMVNSTGEVALSTHVPFSFHDKEVLEKQAIINRIGNAVDAGAGADENFYQADIDRLQEAIDYHTIRGMEVEVDAEMYSVFIGVPAP